MSIDNDDNQNSNLVFYFNLNNEKLAATHQGGS